MTLGALVETTEADGWADIAAACPPALRAAVGLELIEAGGALQFVTPGIDIPLFNRVIRLGVDSEPDTAELDRMLARFQAAGSKNYRFQPCSWAQTERVQSWCREHGLVRRDRYAKVVRTEPTVPPARTSLAIVEVSPERRRDFAEPACAGFGLPPLAADWLAELVGRAGWRCYAATDDGRAVAAGAFRQDGSTAWLGAAATLPSHRGRGAQSALLARRIADALASSATHLVTETGDDTPARPNPSLRNILRAGFEVVHWRDSLGPA